MKKLSFSRLLLLAVVFTFLGAATGSFWEKYNHNQTESTLASQIRSGGYSLINPLLECEIGEQALQKELLPFKHKVTQIIEDKIAHGDAYTTSFYFRDLNNGLWTGIGEKEKFAPASLLKVPLMIAYLKSAETNPELLNESYLFQNTGEDYNSKENIKPSKTIESGKKYTVDDLIQRMIIYSDNNAAVLLRSNIDPYITNKTYTDLGVNTPGIQDPDDYMNIKQYATFFRILYNASYLNKDMSNKALEILSKVEFSRGLRAGVPGKVTIAHKFGEFRREGSQIKQLHDCGIVYYPDHPYLLCIMTKGNKLDVLADTIKTISKTVFEEISSQMKKPAR